MKASIGTRELIVLNATDAAVTCTYHRAKKDSAETASQGIPGNGVGIIFLNSLAATRASNGDAAVHWADAFAESGYPSFRIDFPGYGDTIGELPPDLLKYIDTGGYVPLASAVITELIIRFNLSGVVLAGICAGSVSAQFIAVGVGQACKGLVLLDPHFHLPLTPKAATLVNVRRLVTRPIMHGPLGPALGKAWQRVQALWDKLRLTTSALPSNANRPLLRCWKTLASNGMPILIFKAPHVNVIKTEFDYLRHIMGVAGPRSRVRIVSIDGAGHTFSNSIGRNGVKQHVGEWLHTHFPLKELQKSARATGTRKCATANPACSSASGLS